jgi:glycosyltransferase involved in cell wall biosynthesis
LFDQAANVTVLTRSIPERTHLLAECIASVLAQTRKPAEHLIELDANHTGAVATLNRALRRVRTRWVAFLDDDDLFYPHHLQTLLSVAEGAELVYSWCDVEGRDGWNPNRHFDPTVLRAHNYIPITVLADTATLLELGGFPDVHQEDYAMWLRLLDAGKTIRCIPEVTWRYRFLGNNRCLT